MGLSAHASFIDGSIQDILFAKRTLIRSPLFTLAAVATRR